MTDQTLIADLQTVRDWLRFATSQFARNNVAFGHGTSTALDEAAFLILSCLHLPIDTIDPWLDARLSRAERQQVQSLIEKRVVTRKPAPYLVNAAWIGPHKFYVDDRAIVPRSYIGELLNEGLPGVLDDPTTVKRALDLCTGSGCLAILTALLCESAAVDAIDLSPDAIKVADRNIADYHLADRIRLLQGDLFAPLSGERYDLIISNPPYVTAAAVAAFPPEFKAEPTMAHLGGADGMDLVRRILATAGDHLEPHGTLVVEIGQGRATIEREFPHLPLLWLDTAESEGEVFALPASAFEAPRKMKSAKPRKR
jgi:ribosomal protein L3 glutamine methyltransferase